MNTAETEEQIELNITSGEAKALKDILIEHLLLSRNTSNSCLCGKLREQIMEGMR
jgi:hypothetical protein